MNTLRESTDFPEIHHSASGQATQDSDDKQVIEIDDFVLMRLASAVIAVAPIQLPCRVLPFLRGASKH